MSDSTAMTQTPLAPSRDVAAALGCLVLWTFGALASRVVGLWLGVGVAALCTGVFAVALERRSLRVLLRVDARAVAAGLAMGAFMTAMTYALHGPVTRASPLIASDLATLYATFSTLPPTQALLLLPIPIVCEEIVWRGVVQSALARRVGPVAAVALSALAYAVAHAPVGSLTLTLACIGCGLCWATLRAATGTLIAPLIAHLVWDFSVLVVWPIHS